MKGFLVPAHIGPELALSVAQTDMGEHNVEQELDERKLHEFKFIFRSIRRNS